MPAAGTAHCKFFPRSAIQRLSNAGAFMNEMEDIYARTYSTPERYGAGSIQVVGTAFAAK
jgi:hypothetical protein